MFFWVLTPLDPTSALKMEKVCFSETLASTDESTWRQTPEEHNHPHRRENLITYLKTSYLFQIYIHNLYRPYNSFLHVKTASMTAT
jgi:hypothetical protein